MMDVGEQLSRAHRAEKEQARDMLRLILTSVRFLSRQGLALRGDGSNASANLIHSGGATSSMMILTKKTWWQSCQPSIRCITQL